MNKQHVGKLFMCSEVMWFLCQVSSQTGDFASSSPWNAAWWWDQRLHNRIITWSPLWSGMTRWLVSSMVIIQSSVCWQGEENSLLFFIWSWTLIFAVWPFTSRLSVLLSFYFYNLDSNSAVLSQANTLLSNAVSPFYFIFSAVLSLLLFIYRFHIFGVFKKL